MKTIVKNITNYVILVSLLAILLGVVLIAYPGMSLSILGIAVGIYLIVQGIALIALDIQAWRLFIPFEGLLLGILSVILGVLLLKSPESIATFVGIAVGIWIIVSSFNGIKLACALRGTGLPWVLMLIMNILDIVIGGFILYAPVPASLSLTIALGIVLIAHSVINIVDMIVVKKNARDVEKLIKEKFAEAAPVAETVATPVDAPESTGKNE